MTASDRMKALTEIEERLTSALQEAKEAFNRTRLEFILEQYCGDGRDGKGSSSLEAAADAYNLAVNLYKDALSVFNDFVIRRELPEELK